MKIGALAAEAGVSRDALRFYEKEGLLQSKRLPNGYRSYDADDKELLILIKAAQDLGFSLTEIREILPLLTGDGIPSELAQEIAQQKLTLIDERMKTLQDHKDRLTSLLSINRECPIKLACGSVKAQIEKWQGSK